VHFRACEEAVGEMGAPPTGLPALVTRRRENRGLGVCARTERRALEATGPNATGSHQTEQGHGMQRPMRWKKKTMHEGLTTAATEKDFQTPF
jgi:hypothetical protein